jgi:hypothetical protein
MLVTLEVSNKGIVIKDLQLENIQYILETLEVSNKGISFKEEQLKNI